MHFTKRQKEAMEQGYSSDEGEGGSSNSESQTSSSVPKLSPGKTRSGRDFRDTTPHRSADRQERRSLTPVNVAPSTPSQVRRVRREPTPKESHADPGNNGTSPRQVSIPTAGILDKILNSGSYKIVGFVFALVCILGIFSSIIAQSFQSQENLVTTTSWTPKDRSEYFNIQFKEFVKAFPHQSRETVINLLSEIGYNVAEAETVQPSAFAVLIPPSMKSNFPVCFTKRIGSIVNHAFDPNSPQPVKETDLGFFKYAASVTAIHDNLKKYLDSQGKVVIVHDIEKLDKEEHLYVFHYFCDNSEAYDTRATYFFLIPVPLEIFEEFDWKPSNGYEMATKILTKSWQDVVSEDSIPALISRIVGKVILLNEGDHC